MNSQIDNPFETIESAHDFVTLLSKAVSEAKPELESDVQREFSSDVSRRLDALRMAVYMLDKLEVHMSRSKTLLNDLRTRRRLLLGERKRTGATQFAGARPESHGVASPLASDETQTRASRNSLAA
jgi:hypothetical protein